MKRGKVWLVNLDPAIGAEIRKSRLCVIVNQDVLARLPLKIIVPLTSWDPQFGSAPWHVRVRPSAGNGLDSESSADTFQVRSVLEKRLAEKLGELEPELLEQINPALFLSPGLN